MKKKIILSDEEFNKLPTPESLKSKVVLSDEEFNQLPRPDATMDESATAASQGFAGALNSVAEAGKQGVNWLAKQADRPSAALRQTVNEFGRGERDFEKAAIEGVKGFISPEDAPDTETTLKSVGVPSKYAENPLTQMAADMTVLDPLMLATGGGKLLSTLSRTSATKKLGQISKMAGNSEIAIQNIERNKDVLLKVLAEREIDSNLRRPNELKKILTGKSLGVEDDMVEHFPDVDAGDFVDAGLISKEAAKADDIIAKAGKRLRQQGGEPTAMDVEDILVGNIRERELRPGTGVDADRANFQSQIVERYLGSLSAKPGRGNPARSVSLEELQNLKRELGKRLSSKDFDKLSMDSQLSQEKEVLTEIYGKTKGLILNLSDKVGMGGDLDKVNKKMQAYYTLDQIMTKPAAVQFRVMSQGMPVKDAAMAAGKIALGAGAGTTSGVSLGLPANAGMIGGALFGAKMAGPEIQNIMDYLKYAVPNDQMGRAMTLENSLQAMAQKRQEAPQEARPQPGYDFSGAMPLIQTKLPRDTVSLMNKKEFAKAKVRAMNPEMAEEFAYMLDNSPPAVLPRLLGKFAAKNPALFEYDARNRWDGKMNESVDRQSAIQEVRKRKDLPASQRARTIMKINEEGIIE